MEASKDGINMSLSVIIYLPEPPLPRNPEQKPVGFGLPGPALAELSLTGSGQEPFGDCEAVSG